MAAERRPLAPLIWASAGLLAAWLSLPDLAPPKPAPSAALQPTTIPSAAAPSFSTRALPSAGPDAPSAHAATLAALPDGRVLAAWFAGSREGAPDVAIYGSYLERGNWSPARVLLSRAGLEQQSARSIRKLGNPVLHVDAQGQLHLFVVSVGLGGWAGSAINHAVSPDLGQTWPPFRRLITSPFFNISTLVRTPPLSLDHDQIGLPAYHEFLARRGEWYRLDRQGRVLEKTLMPAAGKGIQPAVVALDDSRLMAVLRDAGPGPGRVLHSQTTDTGAHWQAQAPLPLGNPNASVALLRLRSGLLVLAANPNEGRNQLDLWISRDQGQTWQHRHILARDADGEYSYPTLIQDARDQVHLVYTWQRSGIQYASFNEPWLQAVGEKVK